MPVTGKASNMTVELEDKPFVDDELKIGYRNIDRSSNMGTIEVEHVESNIQT